MRTHFVKSKLLNSVAGIVVSATLFSTPAFSETDSRNNQPIITSLSGHFKKVCKQIYADTLEKIDANHYNGKTTVPQEEIAKNTLRYVFDVGKDHRVPSLKSFSLNSYEDHCAYFKKPFLKLSKRLDEPVEEVLNKAINGAIEITGRDSHTRYEAPEQAVKSHMKGRGEKPDAGIVLEKKNGKIIVKEINQDSPAYGSGLRAGDQLLGVDGNDINQDSLEKITSFIKESEKDVRLEFVTPQKSAPQNVNIKRIIKEDSPVTAKLIGNIAYIKLNYFSAIATDKIIEGIETLEARAEKQKMKITRLVLDLRDNPGGLLDEAKKIADIFIHASPEKVSPVLYSLRDKNQTTVYTADIDPTTPQNYSFYTHVLMDENSASASEIVAAAVAGNDEGIVIGRASYGKSSVQNRIPGEYPDSYIYITRELFFPADQETVHCYGVVPNILVEHGDYRDSTKRDLCGKNPLKIPFEYTRARHKPAQICRLQPAYSGFMPSETAKKVPEYLVQKIDYVSPDTLVKSIEYQFDATLACSLQAMGEDQSSYVKTAPYPARPNAHTLETNYRPK